MRAFVLTGPREFAVQQVAAPVASDGEVVIDVERVGVCGTDVESFAGERGYGFVRLNQLAIEHLVAGR